jgi:hypothetical protein
MLYIHFYVLFYDLKDLCFLKGNQFPIALNRFIDKRSRRLGNRFLASGDLHPKTYDHKINKI